MVQNCLFYRSYSNQILLSAQEIHAWWIRLFPHNLDYTHLLEPLSDDERIRASRFRFSCDRDRYVVSTYALRCILGQYLEISPSDLCFHRSSYGKPYLYQKPVPPTLCFNKSISSDLALIAVSSGRDVGIDIEFMRSYSNLEATARHIMSDREFTEFLSLPETFRTDAFFSCWTGKEAFVKAKGKGLSIPLDQFEVTFLPDAEPQIVNTHWDPKEASCWHMVKLFLNLGSDNLQYSASLVARGHDWNLKFREWIPN